MKNNGDMAAIILAAGLSRRMQRFKPLLPLGTKRVIERVVAIFEDAGIQHIVVVIGHRAAEVRQAAAPLKVHWVENPIYRQGMFTSVRAGIQALPTDCQAFFIHPVDIPLVRHQTVKHLAAAFKDASATILYPTFDGRRGHPTLIRCDLGPPIVEWTGTGGLSSFLQRHESKSLELPVADEAVLLDLDTPDDYQRMLDRLAREGLPSDNECCELFENIAALPAPIVAHCRAVADVAQRLAEALMAAGVAIQLEQVRTAALLHDIARTTPNHAQAGARLLESHGFTSLSPLVRAHMDLHTQAEEPIDEAQVVYLADKLVVGDRWVDLEERFARKMAKYGNSPAAAGRIAARRENARCILAKWEQITGLTIDAIIASPLTRSAKTS
jgi:molybdenum cofactor cytidylyltransferase